jgi:hypothetical protein
VGKAEGKKSLGKPRHRWQGNIKMEGGMDCIVLARDKGPMAGSFEQSNKHSGSIKCWEILEYLHNWRLLKKASAPCS